MWQRKSKQFYNFLAIWLVCFPKWAFLIGYYIADKLTRAWRVERCLDSYRQRQISQSDCEITSNCGKNYICNQYIELWISNFLKKTIQTLVDIGKFQCLHCILHLWFSLLVEGNSFIWHSGIWYDVRTCEAFETVFSFKHLFVTFIFYRLTFRNCFPFILLSYVILSFDLFWKGFRISLG